MTATRYDAACLAFLHLRSNLRRDRLLRTREGAAAPAILLPIRTTHATLKMIRHTEA